MAARTQRHGRNRHCDWSDPKQKATAIGIVERQASSLRRWLERHLDDAALEPLHPYVDAIPRVSDQDLEVSKKGPTQNPPGNTSLAISAVPPTSREPSLPPTDQICTSAGRIASGYRRGFNVFSALGLRQNRTTLERIQASCLFAVSQTTAFDASAISASYHGVFQQLYWPEARRFAKSGEARRVTCLAQNGRLPGPRETETWWSGNRRSDHH
jgi:hypothetical protein